jgi:hypothetical protein
MSDSKFINVFVTSKNRKADEKPCDWLLSFPSGMIYAKQGQSIRLNVISFHVPNNFYNINELNDRFDVVLRDDDGTIFEEHNFTITHGNYNVGTFRDYINRICQDYFQMSYNVSRNRYVIRSVYNNVERNRIYGNKNVYLKPITSGQFFGLENFTDREYELNAFGKEMDYTVNMCSFDKIVLNAYGLNPELMSIENIGHKDPDFERSSILLWVSRTDVPINGTIKYDNEDSGDSYSYNLYDNEINSFRLVLSDEYNNTLVNALDYTLLLRFEIYNNKKGQLYNQIELLSTTLSMISYYLMLLLERFGVLSQQK